MQSKGLFCHSGDLNHLKNPAVAIGNFDGVHRGHQQIFQQLTEYAATHHVDAVALSFHPHPIAYFQPDAPPFLLQTEAEKRATTRRYGVELVSLHFEAIASMSPAQFVTDVLVEGLHASCVMVGRNFRFGKRRSGDISTLRSLCQEAEIECLIIEDVLHDPSTSLDDTHLISSTKVRNALRQGDLRSVTQLLGRPWSIDGRVLHGDAIGQTLGFPTANISFSPNRLLPPPGIYATRLILAKSTSYGAASYIGTRPTFTSGKTAQEMRVEAFVLNAPDRFVIYDEEVELQFIQYVRGDQAFDSTEQLVKQMTRDVAAVEEILENL